MGGSIRVNLRTFICISFVVILIIILSIAESVNLLFALAIILWIWMFSYSVLIMKDSPLLFCFLFSFFVFLLGRQFVYHYLHVSQAYEFLDEVNNYTYLSIIVSLMGIVVGSYATSKFRLAHKVNRTILADYGNERKAYQLATKIVFYICFVGTLGATLMQIAFVQRVGYLASYTVEAGGAGIPSFISYLSRFTPVVFCLYLATKPRKKNAILLLILYEGYAVLTLLTGQRYPFIGISMLILVYFILRNKDENGWIKKYYFILLIIAVPVLMLFMTAYDSIRVGGLFTLDSYLETLEDFFIQQGGSVNVIRRTIYNADQLEDMHLVSLQGVYSSIFENAIGRRLFNITTYSGNSIERAMNSNNLAHRLSYIAYGEGYLLGRGTGSSYIAELLHDFGLIGVFVGSVIYGVLLKKIDRIIFEHALGDGIKLAMIYYLILAPRGGFDSFIGNVFNLQTVIGFFMVWMLTSILEKFSTSTHNNTNKEA